VSEVTIELARHTFAPGGTIEGAIRWKWPTAPERGLAQLVWFTRGAGDPDRDVVDEIDLRTLVSRPSAADGPYRELYRAGVEGAALHASDERLLDLRLPPAPYSFRGTLIQLIWAVEVSLWPGPVTASAEFHLRPGH